GVTAAMYVRSRHGRSDWSRARRQQAVLLGLRNKITQPKVLLHVPELLREWSESVTSDLGTLDLLKLVRQVTALRVENLHGVVLGHQETLPVRTDKQWSVLVADDQAVHQRLNAVYAAGLPGQGTEKCVVPDVAVLSKSKGRVRADHPPGENLMAPKADKAARAIRAALL